MDTVDPKKIARQLEYSDSNNQIMILLAINKSQPFHQWNGYIKRSYQALQRKGLIRHSYPNRAPYIRQWSITPLGRRVAFILAGDA